MNLIGNFIFWMINKIIPLSDVEKEINRIVELYLYSRGVIDPSSKNPLRSSINQITLRDYETSTNISIKCPSQIDRVFTVTISLGPHVEPLTYKNIRIKQSYIDRMNEIIAERDYKNELTEKEKTIQILRNIK